MQVESSTWVYKKIYYCMSMYGSIKVGLFKVIYSNGVTIGYTWSSLSVNGVCSSWTGGLDRWAIVEKSIQTLCISYF